MNSNEQLSNDSSGKWDPSIEKRKFDFSLEELLNYEILLKDNLQPVSKLITKKKERLILLKELDEVKLKKNEIKIDHQAYIKPFWGAITCLPIGFIMIAVALNRSGVSNLSSQSREFVGDFGILIAGLGGLFLLGGIIVAIGTMNENIKLNKINSQEEMLSAELKNLNSDILNLENI